jgi:16S rRNA (guanine966-N2)-methyltransferase
LRIIAGSRKGSRILAPKGLEVRPTGDRVREAMFNLIGPVDGADVLDLFAGTGALGLEALSRGAASAVFVDSDRVAAETVVRNVEKLGLEGARVYREDVGRRLSADAASGRRYDLVLVDPPYRMLSRFLPMLATHLPSVVASDGLVVVESEAKEEPELPLPLRTSRRYGSTRVSLFEGTE